ncbi:MAG: TIGR03862 family flavoprotein [Pseudomonadota bacterium]
MKAAVIGAGPAGLMAAQVMAAAGLFVTVYEAKPSPGRKFLMAGKSGLNLTFEGDSEKLMGGYGDAAGALRPALEAFDNQSLRAWAHNLDQETFVGSTGRVFPKAMKASPLLRAWLTRLNTMDVVLQRNWRWTGWQGDALTFDTPDGFQSVDAEVTILACGGASWARLGSDGGWADIVDVPLTAFLPSNAGVRINWSSHMQKHFGRPIKSVRWTSGEIMSRGEAVLTANGLEGGGVYALTPSLRKGLPLTLDVLPDRTLAQIAASFGAKTKKATVSQWLRKGLKLSAIKVALVNEYARSETLDNPMKWARFLKALPISTNGLAPIDSAISTAGGVPFAALDKGYMLLKRPGVFCAGEMLDWEAPTGGWLLTACFATGAWAGRHAAQWATAGA